MAARSDSSADSEAIATGELASIPKYSTVTPQRDAVEDRGDLSRRDFRTDAL